MMARQENLNDISMNNVSKCKKNYLSSVKYQVTIFWLHNYFISILGEISLL